MTVTISASISFEAESTNAGNDEVASWDLPEGAVVMVMAHEQLDSGTVHDGNITPETPPVTELEPPPES